MKHCIVLIFFLSLVLSSCSQNVEPENLEPDGIVLFEEGNSLIELVGIEDSRCPSDVSCIWAGNAAVSMRLVQNSTFTDFVLHSNPGENTGVGELTVMEFTIELIDVNPLPTSETLGNIALEEYTVELNVSQ